ncbi:MAG: hypothetical protein DMF95_14940 [Acidobacteria bacterium]|nr:MAG: hypothetical protein DMF95_14940 [Acidobacteriota bacterium]
MTTEGFDRSRLCYLDAASVAGPFPTCADVDVWNDVDGKIGQLDGIVLDAETRHVHYLVVATGGTFRRRRYLLPFRPARIDMERHALCVDAHKTDLMRCKEFEPAAFHRFSDDDLIAALFPRSSDHDAQPA